MRRIRGATRKIDSTAANESWNPASSTRYGFQASRPAAARSSACHASRCRPKSHASEPRTPTIPARITDGCGPTASTYAPIAAIAPASAHRRDTPSRNSESERPAGDDGDVRAAHGEQVVEPARAEALLERVARDPGPRRARCPRARLCARRRAPARRRARASRAAGRRDRRGRRAGRRRARLRRAGRPGPRGGGATRARRSRWTGPRGGRSSPRTDSLAPCGGARPGGSSSNTGSCGRSGPQRTTRARTRVSNRPGRAGSSVCTSARSAVPIRDASTLESSAASRWLAHHQPASATAHAAATSRAARIAGAERDGRRDSRRERRDRSRRAHADGDREPDAERRDEQRRRRARSRENEPLQLG